MISYQYEPKDYYIDLEAKRELNALASSQATTEFINRGFRSTELEMNLCYGHTRGYTGPPIISKGLGNSSGPGDSAKKSIDKDRGVHKDKLEFAQKLFSLNLHGKGFT